MKGGGLGALRSVLLYIGENSDEEETRKNRMSTTFDTYAAVKNLERAGFQEAQAEAVVRTVGEAVDDQVATKADLATLRAEIKADFQADLFKTALAIVALQTTLTVALIKLLP